MNLTASWSGRKKCRFLSFLMYLLLGLSAFSKTELRALAETIELDDCISDEGECLCSSEESNRSKLLGTYLLLLQKEAVGGSLERVIKHLCESNPEPGDQERLEESMEQDESELSELPAIKKSKFSISPSRADQRWKRAQKKAIFSWPVDPHRFTISSFYGPRILRGRKGFHQGIDMAAVLGTPVMAPRAGKVIEVTHSSKGYGNSIVIEHDGGYKTRYAHLQRILVKKEQYVEKGKLIGKVGATGKVAKRRRGGSASHLHFEVYSMGKRIDPFIVLA